MSKKNLVSICALVVLFMVACGTVEANWSEDFNDMTFDLPTWQWYCYPWHTYPNPPPTFTHNIQNGPGSNDYVVMNEALSIASGGSAFGVGMGSSEAFSDVRLGAVLNADGQASSSKQSIYALSGRTTYFIHPGGGGIYPGIIANGYTLLMTWENAPGYLEIEIQKYVFLSHIMDKSFDVRIPDADPNKSYYAELDIVGSNPVYITGSLYEYKGGPLVARTPTLIDTNAKDWWEDADDPQTPINDVLVFTSGVSGVAMFNEDPAPAGYRGTFDDVSSISNGPAAVNPGPADGAADVSLDADLSWKEAAFATSRDLWFGKAGNMQKVTPSPAGTTYDPGTLELGRTYEWRVDEIGSTVTGHTWSFSTLPCLVVDDFESYTNSDPNIIYKTWKDGLGYSPGNGTGSRAGYRDPDYAEVTIVHEGKQSMPVDYNNVNLPYYSEVDRTFGAPQNWTVYGVKALTLWLKGYPSPPAGTFVESPAGTYTMTASGTDIWDVPDVRRPTSYHDEFHYAYTAANGDCWITAKVESISNTDPWAKAGVMIRDSTDANSIHAMVCITPGNGVAFQYRTATGGASTNAANITGVTTPCWLALERSGNMFTASYATVQGEWNVLGQMSIEMSNPISTGLSLTAHNVTAVCTAVFKDVALSTGTPSWTHQDIGIRRNSAAPLYVTLQDSNLNTARVVNPDPDIVLTNTWQAWDIALSDFADVNLAAISKITIGIGDRVAPAPDGTGTLYFDDIRLYPPRCMTDRVKSAGDFTGDCFADYEDLDVIAQEWLASGNNLKADANSDNNVNFKDYAVLADAWLEEVLWPQ